MSVQMTRKEINLQTLNQSHLVDHLHHLLIKLQLLKLEKPRGFQTKRNFIISIQVLLNLKTFKTINQTLKRMV